MRVKINGIFQEIENGLCLEKLLSLLEEMPQYYVVAINYNCISNQDYSTTLIAEGDEIEIVSPMSGG